MNFILRSQRKSNFATRNFGRFFLCACSPKILSILAVIFITLFAGFLTPLPLVHADGYPPYWDNSNNAVHFAPAAWPSDSAWIPYTYGGVGIKDQRTNDPSNGGTSPQNYVNVSSQCTDQSVPSIAWYFDSTKNVMFFRWRVEQIANTYATGPSAGPYSSTDPWKSAQWTVMIDIDGDGYREFAFHLNGSSGSPSTAIDVVTSIYSNTSSQSIDYANNPAIYQLFHNPAAFVYKSYGVGDPYNAYDNYILNFRNALNPVPVWPNGSAETVWDYGTTRSTNITTPTCNEYFIDYQIPLAMLNASSVGGPTVTANTPISLSFVTANSLQNPLQKDVVFDGTYTGNPESCLPFGDTMTLGGGYVPQPVVDWIKADGCNTTTLTAQVRDAITALCGNTLTSVNFYYYYDKNANGIADDAGSSWTLIGPGTVDPITPSKWTYAGWNTTGLDRGQYLIGVRAKDNAISGNSNLTFSYLTSVQLPASTPGETNYANPMPTPGVVQAIFGNACGKYAALTKNVSPSYTAAGSNVTFTITVLNSTSGSFNLTSITDALPSGFSYQSAPAEGGTLAASIATRPVNNATGNVTWTFAGGTSIPAGSSRTLIFTAKVSAIAGTYTNSASAVTNDAVWGSLNSNSVDIGVGAPQLTIAKRPSAYSAVPGDTITYTITYSNDSPVNTTGVVITDILPVGLNFIAANNGGIYNSVTRTITWNLGSLASGDGPYTVSYQVTVDQAAAVRTENTATINSAETSPATAKTAIYVPSPLQISKIADKALVDPRGVAPANQVVYTISYKNTGTLNLTGATITDTTMPGFTYTSNTGGGVPVEPSGDGYGNDNGTCETGEPCRVTWTLASPLIPGASGSVTLTLTVTNPYTQVNPATNTAVIDTNETGPFTDGFSVVIREYDCGATKDTYYFHDLDASALPAPWTGAFPGTPLPATLARDYTNKTAPVSPVATTVTATITDASVKELAQFYQDPPLSKASGFSITGTVDIWAYISKNNSGPITVTAYLYDYNPTTGEAVQIGIQAADSASSGQTNQGMIFNITPSGVVRAGNLLMWRFTTQQKNTAYTGPVTFLFDGTSSQGRSDVCFAPLSITMNKTVDLLEASAGQTLAYTITFSNSGQQPVTGATITDTLPAGVTYTGTTLNGVAATPVGGTCTAGTPCVFDVRTSDNPIPFPAAGAGSGGTLSGGQTGTLVINVNINASLGGITTLTNLARLSNASTNPVDDIATTDITHTPTPDVFLQKSADKTLLNPGDTVTYTITAVNVGDAAAATVNVSDTIPSDTYFTYVAGSIAGGDSRSAAGAPTLTWTINTLSPGSTAALTFQILVAASGVPAGVTDKNNSATATEGPRTTTSNTARVSITTNANLSLTKAVSSPVYTANAGTGNGTVKVFDSNLSNTPVQAGSVEVFVAGTLAGTDSGTGTIIGNGLAGSTINYTTGALHLVFLTAPANGTAITASYRQELIPGTTVQYTMVVISNGGSTAAGVAVNDPIPAGMSYMPGSIIYDGISQTDAADGDNAYYDAVAKRVVYTPGNMTIGPDTSHTLKFSVVLGDTFASGSTTVTNTVTASATNSSSKSSSASVVVTTKPNLILSKAAPSLVPYPLAALNGNHNATTTLALTNPPGSRYFSVGDRIFLPVAPYLFTVTAVLSATQVTINQPITLGGGTQVLPVIKYTLYYANNGTAAAPNVTVKDILPANLNYLAATPAPTTAPAVNSNGILKWDLGTLAPGAGGTIVVYTRPTATGSYSNTATMSGSTVSSFASNTVNTTAGALELSKSTSTANVTSSATGTTATYTITLRNELGVLATGVSVTDYLPVGFSYNNTTAAATCNPANYPTAPSRVLGTDGLTYTCVLSHTAAASNRPLTGADWRNYWVRTGAGGVAWVSGSAYTAQNQPTWSNCTVAVSGTATITFVANVSPTVNAGTYQNGVIATSTNMSVLPFDELNTTLEDVTVTIPADLKVAKAVTLTAGCGVQVGCNVTYNITVTNVGTSTATAFTVNDVLPGSVTYVPTYTATEGAWDGTNWVVGGASITTTSSVVTGSNGSPYTCIKRHIADATNRPITGANWQTYWVLGGSSPVAWVDTAIYTSATAKLTITATINSIASTITNTAAITASTFAAGTDTNASNNSSSVSIVPTSIVLSRFDAHEENGQVVVEWETSSEVNTVGFFLSRLNEHSGRYIQLNSMLLPSVLTPPIGGSYSLIDKGALPGKTYTYLLTEAEANGAINTYGPFTITVAKGQKGRSSVSATDSMSASPGISGKTGRDYFDRYIRQAREMSENKKVRLNAAKKLMASARELKTKRQGTMLKIPIEKDGLYYLGSSEISRLLGLSEAEVKRRIRTVNFALSSQGSKVAYLPAEDNSGIFFYGIHTDSIYTKENIYWLYPGRGTAMEYTYDGGPEPVGPTTFTETVHAEENKLIGAYPFLDPEGDFWFWDQVFSGYPQYDTKTFTVETKGAADMPVNATLTVNLQGISETEADPDHHVVVSVNGTVVGEDRWNGAQKRSPAFTFSQQLLSSGDNVVKVRGLLDTGAPWSLFYINSFDLTYQRVYEAADNALLLKAEGHPIVTVYGFTDPDILVLDVTDTGRPIMKTATTIEPYDDQYSVSFVPSSPDRVYLAIAAGASANVTGAWAAVRSGLTRRDNKADYILIVPSGLIEGAQHLADYRQSKGLKTMIVKVEDIMDEFNYGLSSPKAIQSFLTYAYNNWSRPPRYVLLVGDATYDYKDNLLYGENLVPTMVVATPLGLFTSDNILADVNADHVPEIAIGRLPVLTPEELRDVTDKIIAYERNASSRILLLADNADDGGNFPVDSDEFTALIPSRYSVSRIYLSEYQVNDARQMLFDTINRGVGIINYFGHAGTDNLAAENLLGVNDIASLSNSGMPFVLNAMTCMAGQYAFPGADSLSETLLLRKDGGAAAVWAPSGVAFHFDSRLLDEFFFKRALVKRGTTLGISILNSCRSFYNSGGPSYILDIYNLQGDPAMRLW